MIEVEQLTKRYGSMTAVNAISFQAQPGQVTGFLGPNGAGKTTTMRMLTGYMPPGSGKAIVAGHDVFEQSMEVRKRVGYLPENVPLYRDMTTLDYLAYVGEIRGIPKRRERAKEVLAQVGLSDRAEHQIRTLSKGMRQRVGLAQALIHRPEVLILDEPTIGLDPFQVLELRQLVRELGREHTLLFSTHILSEAEQVCDNVVIINHGEIVTQGSPLDLRAQLERGGRVMLRVDVPAAQALSFVQGLPQVASAELALDGILITPHVSEADPRPAIATAVAAQGWGLIELRAMALSLEDIFFELTRKAHESEAANA
jgi:ABC-2 type transport system ATP-binding protein